MSNKYYWLKLKRDFFKRHDIRIIESMPNGKDYILFYLKLLCESIDHQGNLRFSEEIPYNEDMLAVITNTNVDIVRSAIKIFTQLDMMKIIDDGTFFMNEVDRMIGSETEWAEKKRIYRENHRQIEDKQRTMSTKDRTMSSPCPHDVRQEIDIDKDKELDKEKDIKHTVIEDAHESSFDKEFDDVWTIYPRKNGKQNAYKAYVKARKEGTSKEDIIDGIKRYVKYLKATGTEERYIAYGSSWFNQRRWTDEYKVEESISNFDYDSLQEIAFRKALE